MRLIESARARAAFLVVLLVTLLAGDVWRYTVGWPGFLVVIGLIAVASLALLATQRHRWSIGSLPYPLLAFLALALLSTAWSFYPGFTALGALSTVITAAGAVAVAITFTWGQILRYLGVALRIILGLSVVFEFVVAVFIRMPVLPLVPQPGVDYANLPAKIPKLLYWSRDQLFDVFHGGKIQGIVGNSALLSFVALLGIIVFGLQLFDRSYRRRWSILWLAVAVFCFVATRAATNTLGLIAVLVVLAAVLLIRRARTPRARAASYGALLAVVVAVAAVAVFFSAQVLALLGKSPDLTNRAAIWNAVIDLAQQRPVVGWGWVSYWIPWIPPFNHLASNNRVQQLHAHNAWLDIWLQLGILGLIVVGALVLSTLVRSWLHAVDRPTSPVLGLLPLLVLVALIVQSVAESRLLVEYGMFLLVLIAVKTKRDDRELAAP